MELWPVFIEIPYSGPQHWKDGQTNLPNDLPTLLSLGPVDSHLLQREDVVTNDQFVLLSNILPTLYQLILFLSLIIYGHRCLGLLLVLSKVKLEHLF